METKQETLKRMIDIHLFHVEKDYENAVVSVKDLEVILEMAQNSAEVNIHIDMNHNVSKQFTDTEERIAEHRERMKSRREYFNKQWSQF